MLNSNGVNKGNVGWSDVCLLLLGIIVLNLTLPRQIFRAHKLTCTIQLPKVVEENNLVLIHKQRNLALYHSIYCSLSCFLALSKTAARIVLIH